MTKIERYVRIAIQLGLGMIIGVIVMAFTFIITASMVSNLP
jgi:hypothetical protein